VIKKSLYILILVFFAISGFAQDMFIPDSIRVFDDVFILAKKNLDLTGAKVIKIDSIILENKSLSNLSDLLSENTSVFIKTCGRGSLATASFRGTNASHTKVEWNGVQLNSPMLGMVDMSLIPMSVTDEVLIYHGSASLKKNSGALGGLIELNTKPVWSKGFRSKIVSSVGSYSSFDDLIELKFGSEKMQSVTRIYCNSTKNDFEFYNRDIVDGGVQIQKNADYFKRGLMQEFYVRIGEKSMASVKAWYQNLDRGIPTLTTNESGSDNNYNRQTEDFLVYSAEFTHFTDNSRLEISSGANFQNLKYLNKNYINGVGYLKVIDSQSRIFSLYNNIDYKHKIFEKTEFSAVLNYNLHDVKSNEVIRNEGYDTTRNEGGLILSVYTSIIKNFRLGILCRQDIYDAKFAPFIPSFFAEYYIKENLIAKTSIARNNNYPSLNDLYFAPGGNPNLVPEKGLSIDGGLQSVISGEKFGVKSEFSLFYSKIKDWILWRPTNLGFWHPENIQLVETYGADMNLEIKTRISEIDLSSSANYAYTRSVNMSEPQSENDNSVGKQLPYVPIHSANLFLRGEFKKFYISYQWNYFSERYTSSAAEPGILVSMYPYFMSDIAVGKNFAFKDLNCDLNFRIFNIFNESYRSVLWQPMPGINYSLQLTIRFK
jgi:iron complex outermembrane receptor protein